MIERATLAEALSAEGVDVDQARATLAGADDSPLVVRALAGVGAWFAAAFLIGFMAAADMLDNEATWIIFGALLVVGGTALRTVAAERDEGDFLVQLSLAFCLAGQALSIFGVGSETDSAEAALAFGVALEVVLLFVFPDPLQRFVSTVASVWMAAGFIFTIEERAPLHVLAVPCIWGLDRVIRAAAPAGSLRWERLRGPVTHGLAIAGFGLVLLVLVTNEGLGVDGERLFGWGWVTALGASAVFLSQVWRLSADRLDARTRQLLVAGVAVLAAITWTTPAVVVGMSVLTLAWDRREPFLLSLSCVFLATALFALYYDLDLSLLGKSVTLVASGALLLGVRRLLPGSGGGA